jgi:transcriptional regulator GlxA family with amidase domain
MFIKARPRARCYAELVTPEELANLAHLRRARNLMDREYASPLDVAALTRAALMSTAHFSRQFRATYGETPYAYLMTRRIERAMALLRRGDLSVTEVCMAFYRQSGPHRPAARRVMTRPLVPNPSAMARETSATAGSS